MKKRTRKKRSSRMSKAHSRYHSAASKLGLDGPGRVTATAVGLTRLRKALRQAEALHDRAEHIAGHALKVHARKPKRRRKKASY